MMHVSSPFWPVSVGMNPTSLPNAGSVTIYMPDEMTNCSSGIYGRACRPFLRFVYTRFIRRLLARWAEFLVDAVRLGYRVEQVLHSSGLARSDWETK